MSDWLFALKMGEGGNFNTTFLGLDAYTIFFFFKINEKSIKYRTDTFSKMTLLFFFF